MRHARLLCALGLFGIPFCGCGGESAASDAATSDAAPPGDATSDAAELGDGSADANACGTSCSPDLTRVLDCTGAVRETCSGDQICMDGRCVTSPCAAADEAHGSVGCDYWLVKTAQRPEADGGCFAAFVVNAWDRPVHLTVTRGGAALPTSAFAVPSGMGAATTYTPYDPVAGLAPGQAAVLFLSRSPGALPACPVPAALAEETGVAGTGSGQAFHLVSDFPITAYQLLPYGGGTTAGAGATLLVPSASWGTNYVAVSPAPADASASPSIVVVAARDGTEVTVLPSASIVGGPGVPPATENVPMTYVLNEGQFVQFEQPAELTGSVLEATAPIAVFGAHACMSAPAGQSSCDPAEQQLVPIRALGSEYVGAGHRARGASDATRWRLVGVVDGTALAWTPAPPPGAPSTLDLGQIFDFSTESPFILRSQDAVHPFYLGAIMTGGGAFGGAGDPEWVDVTPTAQADMRSTFFTDPTYPETSLTLVRSPSPGGGFADVTLSCAGGASATITGWQPIGGYESAIVDLTTGDFTSVGGCTAGRQELSSSAPFSATVWGWEATPLARYASYGYRAGARFAPLHTVVVHAVPF